MSVPSRLTTSIDVGELDKLAPAPPPLVQTNHKASYATLSPQRPELSQAGRTVLVTGGSAGIGFAIARAYGEASASRVILTGRRSDVLRKAASQLSESYGRTEYTPLVCDVGNATDSAALWSKLRDEGIFVDVLVLSAAKFHDQRRLLESDLGETWSVYDTNVKALLDFSLRLHRQEGSESRQKVGDVRASTCLESRQ